jgi:hypothetical protein
MIIQSTVDTNPYLIYDGMATKVEGETLPIIPEEGTNDVCICDIMCPYTEMVFAKVGDVWWKNDKNDFLFQRLVAADTITIKLFKNGVELATITDDTYGTYYASFPNYALVTGFLVEWEKVFNLEGAGLYQIKADKVILGVASTFESQYFRLLEYTDERADETVRIESYQSGNIVRNQFNFTDMLPDGWYQSFRIRGKLFTPDPKMVIDKYPNQDWKNIQIQDQVVNEWKLETEQLPSIITNKLVYNVTLANTIQITDYNIYNHEIYRRIELYTTEIEKLADPSKNTERSYVLTFSDKTEDIIKRNY